MDQDLTQGMSVAVVFNPTNEDYTTTFAAVQGGKAYTIPANGSLTVPTEIGKHLARSIVVNHIYQLEGRFKDIINPEKVAKDIEKVIKFVAVDGEKLIEEAQTTVSTPKEEAFGGLKSDLESLTWDELRAEAKSRGLSLSGMNREKLLVELSK